MSIPLATRLVSPLHTSAHEGSYAHASGLLALKQIKSIVDMFAVDMFADQTCRLSTCLLNPTPALGYQVRL